MGNATDQMVRSAQEGAIAGGMGAGLGALAMVDLGAVQTTAFAALDTERVYGGYADDEELEAAARMTAPDAPPTALPAASRARPGDVVTAGVVQGTWQEAPRRVVDAPPPQGVLADVDACQRAGLDLSAYTAAHTPAREIRATLVSSGAPNTTPADSATPAMPRPQPQRYCWPCPRWRAKCWRVPKIRCCALARICCWPTTLCEKIHLLPMCHGPCCQSQ